METETERRGQLLYKAETASINTLNHCREKAYDTCRKLLRKKVHVQTVHGEVYDGTVVHVDHRHVYLLVNPHEEEMRQFFSPYPYPYYGGGSGIILPLVLYELLVISLLS